MPRNPVPRWRPSEDQVSHWPKISGNAINGVGEGERRRPSSIYWHPPDSIPHGPLQLWFYARSSSESEALKVARAERQRAIDEPLAPLAPEARERTAEEWTADVMRIAREHGADDVGVALMRADYVFEGREVPSQRWMIVLAVQQDYDAMKSAPSTESLIEVTRQYARGTRVAKGLASWLRTEGHDAAPYGGPMAGSFVLIPAAIEAGLGELGKHAPRFRREFPARVRPHRRPARRFDPRCVRRR